MRNRFTPKPNGGLLLVERDAELLTDLFLHRAMSRVQLQQLYFGSLTRCNVRLRQLFDYGYVKRHYLTQARYVTQAVYSVGKAAAAIIAPRLDLDPSDVANQCRVSTTPTFLEHTLRIVDMLLAFRAAALNGSALNIERWLPETLCRHEYEIRSSNGGSWTKEVFNPDAFVRFARHDPQTLLNYFFEVDLGHISSRQFLSKLMIHQRYMASGLFASMFGCDQFRTLVVTTSETRLRNLLALVEGKRSDLFWFTTFTAVDHEGLIGPVWRVPGQREPLTLIQ